MATDARDFIKCLRMPLEAFECLHKMLKVDIQRNKEMAQRRGDLTEFRQPLQVQRHLEMPRILVQLGHTQRT